MYEDLTPDQQELVRKAFGEEKYPCPGCVIYLGGTRLGPHTYFWHYGASEWYGALPHGCPNPHFDFESGDTTLFVEAKEIIFDLNGRVVLSAG